LIENKVIIAFGLTIFAGLSTGIGSALAFFTKKTNKKFLSYSLGFSAGVMIYVSFVEIFIKAKDALIMVYGNTKGYWITTISFFAGMAFIAIIDKLVPDMGNPHEIGNVKKMEKQYGNEDKVDEKSNLFRMGIFSAIAIAIHNFPEGLATFTSAMKDISIAIPIAIAIAIHNIPEGIAVSVPIYFSTGDKKKAFFYSFLSGLSEPLGAMVGYILLRNFFNDIVFGVLFAAVAGIMVFISLDELLPTAHEYGEHHIAIYGVIGGMVVMALSLLLFV